MVPAAKAVGKFVKTTGAKIAKFGLKVVGAVAGVAAKAVGMIPGMGKIAGKALEGVSKAANIASDKIHVNLGSKLEKGMKIMDKAENVMKLIPTRRDLSEVEAFQRRGIKLN